MTSILLPQTPHGDRRGPHLYLYGDRELRKIIIFFGGVALAHLYISMLFNSLGIIVILEKLSLKLKSGLL